MKRKHIGTIASLALVVVLFLAVFQPAWAQGGTTRLSRLIISQLLTVVGTTTLTGAVTTGGSVIVGDDLTVTDNTVTNDLTTADLVTVSPQPALTVIMNGWITPTGSFQSLKAAGAVSVSGADIADGVHGQLLYLYNMGVQTITITETTGLISAGNIVLGTLDAATLVYSGTTWVQLSASNN